MISAQGVTKYYLYGTPDVPAGPDTDQLIRDDGAAVTVDIDLVEYMTVGPGRFANPASFEVVEKFFNTFGSASSLHGDAGRDTYRFERNDGQDTITESGSDLDTIRFGAGIAAGDVALSRDGNDLVFAIAGSDDRVTVRPWRYGAHYRIEQVDFCDGTVWDAAALAAMVSAIPLSGMGGNDNLSGDSDAKILDGGTGDDRLQGKEGGDTYLFELGDGQDSIVESGYEGIETIRFGAGIAASDIVLSRGPSRRTRTRLRTAIRRLFLCGQCLRALEGVKKRGAGGSSFYIATSNDQSSFTQSTK